MLLQKQIPLTIPILTMKWRSVKKQLCMLVNKSTIEGVQSASSGTGMCCHIYSSVAKPCPCFSHQGRRRFVDVEHGGVSQQE